MPRMGVYRGIVTSKSDAQAGGGVQVQIAWAGVRFAGALACILPFGAVAGQAEKTTVIVACDNGNVRRPVAPRRVR